MNLNTLFDAQSEEDHLEDSIQALLLSCKIAIQKAMQEGGVSKRELSERLGVTPARVSQILSDTNANLTIKTLGKIAHALSCDFEFVKKSEYRGLLQKAAREEKGLQVGCRPKVVSWHDYTANINKNPLSLAA